MASRHFLSHLLLLGGLFFCFGSIVRAQEEAEFNPSCFNVELSLMMPVAYPLKSLSYGYSIGLRNDTAFVCLPYVGRVYQPGFDHDGLTFELPVKQYTVCVEDGETRVEFRVKKAAAVYRFVVTAYFDGRADVMMVPEHAQSISYSGFWNGDK